MCESIRKIHATGLSLNERFTAIAPYPETRVVDRRRSRSRSRSAPRGLPPVNRETSMANRRLLQQLAKKHKIQAALKLKRRSMRTAGGNVFMRRGTIKALRVAANGKPIKANSLTNIATMKADLISNGNRNSRPLRRANSISSVSNRLGSRRLQMGGAAQRVAERRMQRLRARANPVAINRDAAGATMHRGRSRSRSRGRVLEVETIPRGRSRSRGRAPNVSRGISRGRSRSRSRINGASARAAIPIKDRLGVRPGTAVGGDRNRMRGGARNRRASVTRGVTQGRIQRRRNSTAQGNNSNLQRAGGAGGRMGRTGGRIAARNLIGRSRSRTRRGAVVGQRTNSVDGNARRGRNQQRRGRGGVTQRNGNTNGNNRQQQQRRGRSRSRGGVRGGGRGGRNQGKNIRRPVDRDALDKELDQYMATTKTEMDYLLKN